jgi:hypothetical protein
VRLILLFAWTTCLPALATAAPAPDQKTLREECSASSQAGMRDCLASKAENSRKALRQAQEQAATAVGKWDEDGRYVSQARAKLATANREFSKYLDAQCEFAASLSGGGAGNSHEIGRLACIAELNGKRAEQLRDSVSDLPLK